MIKVNCIIAGSRTITNYMVVCLAVARFQIIYPELTIVSVTSGGADGVDKLGERWAHENHCGLNQVKALWNLHGKKAGMIRNVEMAKLNEALVAIWDGKSTGTKHMIETAYKHNLTVMVQRVQPVPKGFIKDEGRKY